ncbi:MAG: sigma-70 family RNA polymerase sigma factor [Armatimonadota bacterium]|nr:sigma-70 family RNA polymerase sigma factor [Armatimonadota bacterium]
MVGSVAGALLPKYWKRPFTFRALAESNPMKTQIQLEQPLLTVSDGELVSQAQRGSLTAFDELVARHQERIFALAYRVLWNREDAADIQQETFVRAWTRMKSFRGHAAFTTWLHRIALNLCLTKKRRRDWLEPPATLDEEVGCRGGSFGTICAEKLDTAIAVREAVAALPARQRALIVLKEIEGRSCEEIAEIVGGSAASVRTRLSRARTALREKMRPYLEEEL